MAEEFLQLENSNTDDKATDNNQTDLHRERIKHLLIGSKKTVRATMNSLHSKGYAEVREWSNVQPASLLGEPGEVVIPI